MRLLIIRARGPGRTSRLPLGIVYEQAKGGWRFTPLISGRLRSRVDHPTWEKALPRWTGGLDRTESILMLPGEAIPAALSRFPEYPA